MTDESLRDASRRNAQSARPPRSMMSSTAAALKPKPDCICRCSISFLLPFGKRSYYIIFSAKTVGHSRNPPRQRLFPWSRPIKSMVPLSSVPTAFRQQLIYSYSPSFKDQRAHRLWSGHGASVHVRGPEHQALLSPLLAKLRGAANVEEPLVAGLRSRHAEV